MAHLNVSGQAEKQLGKLLELKGAISTYSGHKAESYVGVDLSFKGTVVTFMVDIELSGEDIYGLDCLNAVKDLFYKREYEDSTFIDSLIDDYGSDTYAKFDIYNLARNLSINYLISERKLCISYKLGMNSFAKYYQTEIEKIRFLSKSIEYIFKDPLFYFDIYQVALQSLDYDEDAERILSKKDFKLYQAMRSAVETIHGPAYKFWKRISPVQDKLKSGSPFIVSIEDVNVSSHFTGMRAVAFCYALALAGFAKNHKECPVIIPVSKSSIDAFVRKYADELYKQIESGSNKVGEYKKGKKNKKNTIDALRLLTGKPIVDDDLSDSVSHSLFISNLMDLVHLIKPMLSFLSGDLDNKTVSENYKSIRLLCAENHISIETLTNLLKKGRVNMFTGE